MKDDVQKVYGFYKSQHPNKIVLFRVGEDYVAYYDDAVSLAEIMGDNINSDSYGIAVADYFNAVRKIAERGIGIISVVYRDDDGQYTLPDLDKLQEEEEMDY